MSEPTASPFALVLSANRILGSWNIAGVSGVLPGAVAVRLERDTDGASLQIIINPKGTAALVQTSVGAVYYKKFAGISEADAASTTRQFADLLEKGGLPLALFFPHLAMSPKPSSDDRERFAALVGAQLRALPGHIDDQGTDLLPSERRELYFDPPGIAEFMSPELVVDGPPVAGHVLKAIYLPSMGRRQSLDFQSFVLEFAHAETGDSIRLRLTAGGHDEGFGRVGEMIALGVIGYTGELDELPVNIASLSSWVLALFRLKFSSDIRIFVPTRTEELRALNFPSDRAAPTTAWTGTAPPPGTPAKTTGEAELKRPPALNLALDTECNQQCVFCSVKSYVKPTDNGAVELDNLRFQLRMSREAGVEEVRLNGIDPLTFSRVLDLVESVREFGFSKLSVYSPCRRFADDNFRAEFLQRAPRQLEISVPLYGITAAAHDAATGAPGAHAQVMRAIEGLLAVLSPSQVNLTTVVVKQNVHELVALTRFARERGMAHHIKVPYPMRQTTRDPYADSVVRESEIINRYLDDLQQLPDARDRLSGLSAIGSVGHPCLHFQAERKRKLPVFGERQVSERPLLPGTEYRSSDKFVHDSGGAATGAEAFAVATVACPHVARCALAPVCPGEHYAVYQQLFGFDEFSPVSSVELYRAIPVATSQSDSPR